MPTPSVARRKPAKGGALQGNKVWFAFAIACAVVVAGLVFVVLQQVSATVTYYVLNTAVPARTQITATMLTPVVTNVGGQPRNALDLGYITATPTFAKYALSTGDLVTTSNTGAQSPINEGIPEGFVVASFPVSAENAVAGKVARGDYIDVIAADAASETSTAKYVLRRVLVLDTAANLAVEATTSTASTTAEDGAVRTGVPTLYTVALNPTDAAKLALLGNSNVLVVLTSAADVLNGVQPENIVAYGGQVFGDESVGDSGVGTDPTFGQADKETSTVKVDGSTSTSAPSPSATPAK